MEQVLEFFLKPLHHLFWRAIHEGGVFRGFVVNLREIIVWIVWFMVNVHVDVHLMQIMLPEPILALQEQAHVPRFDVCKKPEFFRHDVSLSPEQG